MPGITAPDTPLLSKNQAIYEVSLSTPIPGERIICWLWKETLPHSNQWEFVTELRQPVNNGKAFFNLSNILESILNYDSFDYLKDQVQVAENVSSRLRVEFFQDADGVLELHAEVYSDSNGLVTIPELTNGKHYLFVADQEDSGMQITDGTTPINCDPPAKYIVGNHIKGEYHYEANVTATGYNQIEVNAGVKVTIYEWDNPDHEEDEAIPDALKAGMSPELFGIPRVLPTPYDLGDDPNIIHWLDPSQTDYKTQLSQEWFDINANPNPDTVSNWEMRVGNSNNDGWDFATEANQPPVGPNLNGIRTINPSGHDTLRNSGFGNYGSGKLTFATVINNYQAQSGGNRIFDITDVDVIINVEMALRAIPGNIGCRVIAGGSDEDAAAVYSGTITDPLIIVCIMDGTTGVSQTWINGSLHASGNCPSFDIGPFTSGYNRALFAKHNNSGLNSIDAEFGDMGWFDEALDTDRRQLVEGFFAHKYGLQGNLPASHPWKTIAPTNESLL